MQKNNTPSAGWDIHQYHLSVVEMFNFELATLWDFLKDLVGFGRAQFFGEHKFSRRFCVCVCALTTEI